LHTLDRSKSKIVGYFVEILDFGVLDWDIVNLALNFVFVVGMLYILVQFTKPSMRNWKPLSRQNPLWVRVVAIGLPAIVISLAVLSLVYSFQGLTALPLSTPMVGILFGYFLFLLFAKSKIDRVALR